LRDPQKDVEMYDDKLFAKGHWSPFEHVCQVPLENEYNRLLTMAHYSGNLQYRAWIQYRQLVETIEPQWSTSRMHQALSEKPDWVQL
jgi:hypothetical protein